MIKTITFDTKRFQDRIDRIQEKLPEAVQKGLDLTAIESSSVARLAETAVVTARLRSSIHFENQKTKQVNYKDKYGITYNGMFVKRPEGLMVIFGTNVEYALKIENRLHFMEQGWKYAKRTMLDNVDKYVQKLINE